MLFVALTSLAISLTVSINDKKYTGSTYDDILQSYGSDVSTIVSLIVNEGQFPLISVTNKYSQLSTLHVPRESFIGEVKNTFLRNIKSLTDVKIDGAAVIQEQAFQHCTGLKTISFEICEKIGNYAFMGCTSLETIYFKSCTVLGNYAFEDCTALSSIDLPILNVLGFHTFMNTALEEVYLDSVTTVSKYNLGSRQFSDCTKLTHISMKNALVIPNFMFAGCYKLSSYDFPLVTEIGESAFRDCQSITNLNFPNLLKIGEFAFARLTGFQEIDFPKVNTIEEKAFQYCTNLKYVSLSSCSAIGQYAFQYCSSLTSIDMPNLLVIQRYAFYQTALTKVQLDSPSDLGVYIFSGCSKLTQVSMRSAPAIKKGMFENCYQLSIIDFPACNTIEEYGLKGCTDIRILTIGFQKVDFTGIPSPSYLQKINFPKALSINNYALSGLPNLAFCYLPSVNTIEADTFKGLSKLVELEIPSVTELKENAFTGCTSLASISLKSLKIVDSSSTNIFNGCQNLKTIFLPDSPPKTFHKDTFKGMNCKIEIPLDAVTAYDNDVSIDGDKANDGYWCGIPLPTKTISVKINNQKDTFSGQQLSDCIKLSGISESLITSLEVVNGIIKLSTIIESVAKLPVLEDLIISDSVIIEDGLIEGLFKDIQFSSITIEPSIDIIPKNCFQNCANLKSVKITNCKEIEDSAFKGCINLNSVIINAETLSGDSHFEDCTSLTTVALTHLKNVDPASSKIFLNCPLNSLYFPPSPPRIFHPDTFIGKKILFFGLTSNDLKNYDSNTEVKGDVANDHKWCGIDLSQIYIEVSINGKDPVSSDGILNAISSAGITYVQTIDITGGYVSSSIMSEIKGITSLTNLKISERAALESYIINSEQFKDHYNLQYITIMHDVSLSENCFMGCSSLMRAEFKSATLLSEGCFRDCTSLTSLTIPECQRLKGDYIFANCERLTILDLSSLLYVDNESENIFSGCTNLVKIMLPSIEPTTFNKNSFKDCQDLVLVLPRSADYIKYDDNSKVTDDVIEDNKWCGINFDPEKSLQSVLYFKINDVEYKRRNFKNLPIKSSGMEMLEENVELKSLELIEGDFDPSDLKEITSGSTTLEKFVAHEETVKSISSMTFYECSSLKEITILGDFEKEYYAFQHLPALTSLTLPMLKVVHSDEFEGDFNLEQVSLSSVSSIPIGLFATFEKLNDVYIPSATILNDNCFLNCVSLKSISLPSVTQIFGDNHFCGCTNLESIYLPSLVTVDREGSSIFRSCNKLKNLTLPNEPPSIFHKDVFKNAGTVPTIHLLDDSEWKNYYKQCTVDSDTGNYHWYGINLNVKKEDDEEPVVNVKEKSTKSGVSVGALVGAIFGTAIGSIVLTVIVMMVVNKYKQSSKVEVENEP